MAFDSRKIIFLTTAGFLLLVIEFFFVVKGWYTEAVLCPIAIWIALIFAGRLMAKKFLCRKVLELLNSHQGQLEKRQIELYLAGSTKNLPAGKTKDLAKEIIAKLEKAGFVKVVDQTVSKLT